MYNQWHPKIGRGWFYMGDQQFYLYADKQTATLQRCTWYEFELDETPSAVISARFGNLKIPSDDLALDGRKIRFRSTSVDAIPGQNILLTYMTRSLSAGKIVQAQATPVSLYPADGKRRIFLDPLPIGGYPIIFTDDAALPHAYNDRNHPEFDVNMDTGEVRFMGVDKNRLWNSSFSVWGSGRPVDWTVYTDSSTGNLLQQDGYLTKYGYLLGNLPSTGGSWGDNYISQQMYVDEGEETFTLSFYARKKQFPDESTAISTQVQAGFAWVNEDGQFLNGDGRVIADTVQGLAWIETDLILTGLFDPTEDWARFTFTFGAEANVVTSRPSTASRLALLMTANDTVVVSNIQVEVGAEATEFVYAPRLGTFEYEGSDADSVLITNVDLNPANVGRGASLLNIGLSPSLDIEPELY